MNVFTKNRMITVAVTLGALALVNRYGGPLADTINNDGGWFG